MIYSFTINTPSNTPETSKIATDLKLCRGVIHKIDVLFPPGPLGLLHLTINQAVHQIFPTNAEENLASDDETISFNEHLELEQPPYQLTAWTWNLDKTYSHTLIIRIGILEKKYIVPVLPSWIDRLKFLIGA